MFNTVNLEMSLKPFKETSDEYITNVCKKVFEQWHPLLKDRDVISVMLWTSDGSEILDYDFNQDKEFEWCSYIGCANRPLNPQGASSDVSLHERKFRYIPSPPKMTYRILKTIVASIKAEGKKAFPNATIRVGETFDIGPEFAISDFKYNRHREICSDARLDSFGFVDCTALLNGDDHVYAAYPHGIPDKTPFGTFLGKQSEIFLKDMGFDYLWLSNGLGFSSNPWNVTGKVFDGKNFHSDKLLATKARVFDFWKLFRQACPDIPIEVRGTNNSAGIDYATDGVPLYDIYNANLGISSPPNSPWAALNDNFGLEIMGHMTRICELPCRDFMFRYYIHDPWWANSPWYDRYNGSPHDIYLPMAISRIDENGNVDSAGVLNILSIDNSFGDMPDSCVNEPLPHLLKAEKDCADAPAPLVWVYPMREYTSSVNERELSEMYYGDSYISNAINTGFPLNCVVSTDNFLKTPLSLYSSSILVSPVPSNELLKDKLKEFTSLGGRVIYYGSAEALTNLDNNCIYADISDISNIHRALEKFGFSFKFKLKAENAKPPVTAISKKDNAYLFSVYNPNLTTDSHLLTPLGAPIMTGCEVELLNGSAVYRFAKSEHRECRVFVKQESGIISLLEKAPVNMYYHRKLLLRGLNDATVYIFPENHCIDTACIGHPGKGDDDSPVQDTSFKKVFDPVNGTYYCAEHVSGSYNIMLPRKHI